jgi:glutathione synthase/RimK-type ligase-like ATP-grasp enzyme
MNFKNTIIYLIDENKIWGNRVEKATGIKTINCNTSFILNNASKVNYMSVIIPRTDYAAMELSKYKYEIKKNGYKFLSSDIEIIENLSDKKNLSTNTLVKYLPKIYNINNIIYPFILKKRSGEWGTTVYLINNECEYKKKVATIDNLDDYILQEAIISKYEYSTQFLVINGKIILMYTKLIEAKDELFIRGRYYQNIKTTQVDSKLIDKTIFEKFFKHYNGFINCNFKIKHNNIIILEFNTRLAGNILSMHLQDLNELIITYIKYC